MKYDAVFFDLDGTILDTSQGVIKAIDYIEKTYHLVALPIEEKMTFIGPPIQDSFQYHYHLTKEQAWELATAWRNIYKKNFLFDAKPYEGIYKVLRFCRDKGIKTGVATNKREDYTMKILIHFHFTSLFDCIAGTDFAGKQRKTDLIRKCMQYTDVLDGRRCLMVGDTEGDWRAAEQAGVHFLGVTYGFGYKKGTVINDHESNNTMKLCDDINSLLFYIMEE